MVATKSQSNSCCTKCRRDCLHEGSDVCISWSVHESFRQKGLQWEPVHPWPLHPVSLLLLQCLCPKYQWHLLPSFSTKRTHTGILKLPQTASMLYRTNSFSATSGTRTLVESQAACFQVSLPLSSTTTAEKAIKTTYNYLPSQNQIVDWLSPPVFFPDLH